MACSCTQLSMICKPFLTSLPRHGQLSSSFKSVEETIVEAGAFGSSADRPCLREQSVSINGDAMRHLFKTGDDLEIQAPMTRHRLLLQSFNKRLGDILDGQSRHMHLLPVAP